MDNLIFSVIVPVYNKASVVERAIESVLNQTYRNYEIIIVNDGSTDNSYEVITELKKNNSNIRVINQDNKGVSVARNIGIENAIGECIVFLDPDDCWYEDHLSTLYNIYLICDKKMGIYFTCFSIKMIDGTIINSKEQVDKMILYGDNFRICYNLFPIYNKFKHGLIHTNSVMMPKKIFKTVGMFMVGCKRSQDIDLWFRTMIYFPAIVIGKTTTCYYREESTATASQTRNFEWPFFDTAEKMLENNLVRNEIVESLIIFLDELRINMAYHMIMFNERKKAFIMLLKVRNKKYFVKRISFASVLFFIPSELIKKTYFFKQRKYIKKDQSSIK